MVASTRVNLLSKSTTTTFKVETSDFNVETSDFKTETSDFTSSKSFRITMWCSKKSMISSVDAP